MKANNYLVTYDDLTTMGLTTKTTAPTGTRIATKSFINTYYYVDNTYLSGYANNQCVMYQDIIGNVPNSNTLYYLGHPDNYTGFASASSACAHSTGGSITAYYYGTLGNGTYFFSDTSGTPIVGDNNYFSMNGYYFFLGYYVVNYTVCASTTYLVTLHAKQNSSVSGRYLWYSTNGGTSYNKVTSPSVTTSDQSFGTITVNSGTTIILAIGDNISVNDGTTAASVGVGAYASLPSGCPGRVSPPAIYSNQIVYVYGNSSSFDLSCT